jgi:integrase
MLPTKTDGARTPTKGAVERFLMYSQRFANHTQRRYRDTLYRFSAILPEFVEDIRAEHIDQYLLSRRISNNSRNTELVPIRSFFAYLEKYYGLENIAKKVNNFPKYPPKQRVISEIEYRKILKESSEKERRVIIFLANTGVRSQEFCDLTPGAISPDLKYMTIIGKGSRRRIVPLNTTARECIPSIFTKKYNRDKLSWLCLKLSQKAGIPRFGPHALRHFFVTELIKRNVPISIVSKIVGHKSPQITFLVYTHLLLPDYLGVTDCLDCKERQA